ncbi:hypothetical protein LJC00_01290 [Dysgonomonas sp. OttesenSCG-928-M03]|nr:hypothetical protein [Dysgonomonas sp. OttesenSCG-928-M03]
MKSTVPANFVILFLLIGMISCNSGDNRWNDKMQLSTKRAELMAESDSVTISIAGNLWRLNDVNANGNYFYVNPEDTVKDFMNIKGDWFSVEKQGDQKLVVKVSENTSKMARKMIITLESGNYFDYINVFQKGME